METLDLFTHQYKVQLRFTDFDLMGHVNNTKHLVFIESARIDYMETIQSCKLHEKEVESIVAHIEIDYLKPILPGEKVSILTRCSKIGNKSYELESLSITGDIKDRETISIVAIAKTIIVSYNYKESKTFPLTNEYISLLKAFEKNNSIE